MAEPTVQCGCGRRMSIDARNGKGAYRCGCGARVKVTQPETVGVGCMVDSCLFPDSSASAIVRVCAEHAKALLVDQAPRVYLKYPTHKWPELVREYEERFGLVDYSSAWVNAAKRMQDAEPTQLRPRETHPPVVYFIVFNGRVKIGTTNCLKDRLAQMCLPPDAGVAVTLDGSESLERMLHHWFREERLGGSEWFVLSPRIEEFIASSRKRPKKRSAT